ncbi:RES family NAD+ phosphorylase [Sphingomonas sp. 3-13AW]|uniref:RES family NAD+ phosphorylase n=1 Tax=Sphingomonas sp. 3-13AW TaxID=3050450 RepID=UPI003BB606F4
MLEQFPQVSESFPRTVRLVSTARLREAAMSGLIDTDEEADELAEIEGATSRRLVAQSRGVEGLSSGSLIAGRPNQGFINAAFVYAQPRSPNRFNGTSRGAWYAALDTETAIAEVGHHMTHHFSEVSSFEGVVEYAELFADFIGAFVDLRGATAECLDPNPKIGYPAGNLLAEEAMAADVNGIIYPSVRRPGGTCLAVLWPHAVQNVTQGAVYRLIWAGTPNYSVERVA